MPRLELTLTLRRWARRLVRALEEPKLLVTASGVAALTVAILYGGLSTWPMASTPGEQEVRISGFQWLRGTAAVVLADMMAPDPGSASSVPTWASATLAHRPNATARSRFLAAVAHHSGTLDEVTAQLAADRALSVLSGEVGPDAGLRWATRALWIAERFDEVPGAWSARAVAPDGDVATAIAAAMEAGHGEVVPELWARLPAGARSS